MAQAPGGGGGERPEGLTRAPAEAAKAEPSEEEKQEAPASSSAPVEVKKEETAPTGGVTESGKESRPPWHAGSGPRKRPVSARTPLSLEIVTALVQERRLRSSSRR